MVKPQYQIQSADIFKLHIIFKTCTYERGIMQSLPNPVPFPFPSK